MGGKKEGEKKTEAKNKPLSILEAKLHIRLHIYNNNVPHIIWQVNNGIFTRSQICLNTYLVTNFFVIKQQIELLILTTSSTTMVI